MTLKAKPEDETLSSSTRDSDALSDQMVARVWLGLIVGPSWRLVLSQGLLSPYSIYCPFAR